MVFVAVFIGLPGSGKSTIIGEAARLTGASVVCRDRIRDAMFRPCAYTDVEKQAAYGAVLSAVQVNAQLERSSFVDGMCFTRAEQVQEVRALARANGAEFRAFYCDCPVEVAMERVEADRVAGRHFAADRDAALVAAVASSFEPPPADAVTLDMSRPSLENLSAVLSTLP